MMKPSIEYLAGFMDGEGCISFIQNGRKRTSLSLRLTLVNTNVEVLLAIHAQFGGTLEKPFNNVHKPFRKTRWRLLWYCNNAVVLLAKLLPYLIVKRPQAELALTFREVTTKRRLHKPLSQDDLKQNLEFHARITEMNKRGAPPTERGLDFKRRVQKELSSEIN